MKKYSFAKITTLLAITFLFFSCHNLIDVDQNANTNNGKILVTGSIQNILDDSGARSASSTWSGKTFFYKITAEAAMGAEKHEATISSKNYSMWLEEGSWSFTVQAFLVENIEDIINNNPDPVLVSDGPKLYAVSQENKVIPALSLKMNSDKNGTFALNYDVSNTAIKSFRVTLIDLFDASNSNSFSIDVAAAKKGTFSPSGVNPKAGFYQMKLEFYSGALTGGNVTGSPLYSTTEMLTLLPGASPSGDFTVSWSYSENCLTITNEDINRYKSHTVYVDANSMVDSKYGSYFDPFKSIKDAYNYINLLNDGTEANVDYKIILKSDVEEAIDSGTEALLVINPDNKINLTIESESADTIHTIKATNGPAIHFCAKGGSTPGDYSYVLQNVAVLASGTDSNGNPNLGVYLKGMSLLGLKGGLYVDYVASAGDSFNILIPEALPKMYKTSTGNYTTSDSGNTVVENFTFIPGTYDETTVYLGGAGFASSYEQILVYDQKLSGGGTQSWVFLSTGQIEKQIALVSKLKSKPAEGSTIYVKTAEDLKALADFTNTGTCGSVTFDGGAFNFSGITIEQLNDIDLKDYTNWEPIGDYNESIQHYFSGTYDGNGKVIENLKINTNVDNAPGLFGNVKSAEIKNFTLKGEITCSAVTYIGGIVSILESGSVHDCVSEISINSTATNGMCAVGGIVGYAHYSSKPFTRVYNCENKGKLKTTGMAYTGGIIGCTNNDTYGSSKIIVYNCANSGEIKNSSENAYKAIGGIFGKVECKIELYNCLNKALISGDGKSFGCAGGLVGEISGSVDSPIKNCVNIGNVQSANSVKQIIGNSSYPSNVATANNVYYIKASGYPDGFLDNGNFSRTDVVAFSMASGATDGTLESSVTVGSNSATTSLLTALNNWVTTQNATDSGKYLTWSYNSTNGLYFGTPGADPVEPVTGETLSSLTSKPSSGDTVLVSGKEDLLALANFVNTGKNGSVNFGSAYDFSGVNIVQTTDLDLSSVSDWTPIGTSSHVFAGNFDGNNKKIQGLAITTSNTTEVPALFGVISDATVKNVDLSGVINSNNKSVAGLVNSVSDYFTQTKIENCKVDVSITASATEDYNFVGGIVARVNNSESLCVIDKCVNLGALQISAKIRAVGGIVGFCGTFDKDALDDDTQIVNIINCVNKGDITYTGFLPSKHTVYEGGLLGEFRGYEIDIWNSANKGTIIGVNEVASGGTKNSSYSAGLIGSISTSAEADIKNCFNITVVTGATYNTALLGYQFTRSKTTIANCYWMGESAGTSTYTWYNNTIPGTCISKFSNSSCDINLTYNGTLYYYATAILNAWITDHVFDSIEYLQWTGTTNNGQQGIPSLAIEW